MRHILLILLLLTLSINSGKCQLVADTVKVLHPVTITAYSNKSPKETSINISSIKVDSLTNYGNFNLTDMIARTPGVTMLSTGVAISKPVVRGLYGNRLLVLLSGLKFDNQQWQEEHGMGLSDFGLSEVELIKGPMSILYGTEAIGGIINLIEEEKPAANTKETDFGLRFNSNTRGGLLQAGFKKNTGNKWWRLRAAVENNADYSAGSHSRVLNSRFDGYNLKGTYGFQKQRWTSTNNFMSSFNRYGFIFNDIYLFVTPDNRWSRKLNVNPAHLVLLNILSSENKFIFNNSSKLNLNIGVQSNERMENEGGGAISLNMHLLTTQYLLKWQKQLSARNILVISNLGSFEDNTNFGARKIVPDANMQESNLSCYLESHITPMFVFENGVGIGEKWIKTYFTPFVNGPEKEVHPFTKFSPYYNLYTGATYFPNNAFNIKGNIATGVRIANLAELSSNGLHEGIFTYEIGDPSLKNEQNISFNLFTNYTLKYVEASLSPFYNYFYNYIYLTPTNEKWYGFPVYRYKQQDATQYGLEGMIGIKPIKELKTNLSYSGMLSKTQDDNYTPYMPAQKITASISYKSQLKVFPLTLHTNGDYYFTQNKIAPYEVATPSYWLWNAGLSSTFMKKNANYTISITGNNLLNTLYYDHLSRFKYFGLYNMGRNFALNLKIKFINQVRES